MPSKWIPIEGTEGRIEVSSDGKMRSLLRGEPKVLKAQKDSKGYLRVRVSLDRVKVTYKVHREVAKAFIPNPSNLPQVNHIDGDKTNNDVTNLEWVSNRDNCHHAIREGLWDSVLQGARQENERRQRPVVASKNEETMLFASVREAERYFGSRHICDVLKGKRHHVRGWSMAYGEKVM